MESSVFFNYYFAVLLHHSLEIREEHVMGFEKVKLVVICFLLNQSRKKISAISSNKLGCQANKVHILLVQCRWLDVKLRIWGRTSELDFWKNLQKG